MLGEIAEEERGDCFVGAAKSHADSFGPHQGCGLTQLLPLIVRRKAALRKPQRVSAWLQASEVTAFCVGSISEVFDAEPPFTPRGCIAQAWSVAEVIRSLVNTSEE
ncbi:MAG: amylo-alpha-1,6-glucosidase [Syntrophobacteraceae bacterium]